MIVLGPVGRGKVWAGAVAAEVMDAYGVGAGATLSLVGTPSGTVEIVVCSGDASELAAGVVITEYEIGISLEDMTVLLAGQSVTSSAQEVIVTADVE
jgi:hypothetical protein